MIAVPFFSLISFAAAGVSGAGSVFGVSAASSSLVIAFTAAFALDFGVLALPEGSVTGVLGVESFSFVLVLGVLAA